MTVDRSTSLTPINLPIEAQIPRQVTFAPFQTGTQHSAVVEPLPNGVGMAKPKLIQSAVDLTHSRLEVGNLPTVGRENRLRKLLHLPYWLDCPLVCYVGLATLLFIVGLTVTIITTDHPSAKAADKAGDNGVQIWIIGPTFMCAAILVAIKCGTHVYDRITERQREAQRLARAALGHILTSDSRASMNGTAALPPTYNSALNAAVPSTVITEIEKPEDFKDSESLRLVTLNFEPLPPSYDEALDLIRIRSDPSMKVTRNSSVVTTKSSTTGVAISHRCKRAKSMVTRSNSRHLHRSIRAATL